MQRLTKLYGRNAYGLVNVRDDEQEVDSPHPNTLKAILQSFARLGEYEDILYADGKERITLDRLRELVQADAEGRAVVLPHPIGSKLYHMARDGVLKDKAHEIIVNGYSESPWQGRVNEGKDSRFIICHNSYNEPRAYQMCDVFLTRAEAEEKGEQE